jgi:AcrR family transcriptional regulator
LKTASLKLIARHGVEGFSLRQAAAAVGVSPSAAYHDYKAALLGAVATDGLAAMAQSFEQAILDAHASAGSDAKGRALAAFEALGSPRLRQRTPSALPWLRSFLT